MIALLRRLAAFAAVCLVVSEIFFRLVVPASEQPLQARDPDSGIPLYDVNGPRTGVFTVGRLAYPRFHWRINNCGWNSVIDYAPAADRRRPCVAVIGSSYIEGFYCDVDKNVTGMVQRALGDSVDVYNLGTSASNLAESILVARYAQRRFQPSLIIIETGFGGIRRSIRDFDPMPTVLQYAIKGDTLKAVPPQPFRPRRFARILRRSALVRYLWINSGILGAPGVVRQQASGGDQGPASPEQAARLRRETLYETQAANLITATLARENPGTPILIFMDANRRDIYANGRADPLPYSGILQQACAASGLRYLDLTDAFNDAWRREHRSFNYSNNYHWNEHGYAVVADALARYLRESGLWARIRESQSHPVPRVALSPDAH